MTFPRPGRRVPIALSAVLLAVLVAATDPTPVHASAASDAEATVVDLINRDRIAAGLVPLRVNWDQAAIADTRAARMASRNVANHTVGGNLAGQLDARDVAWYGYGEAVGYSTRSWATSAAQHLVQMWMASKPHRALLMSSKLNYIGVGLARRSSNGRTYGAVVLTDSRDVNGARAWFLDVKVTGDDIRWTWNGADLSLQTRTAGLRDYDVQYRVGSGSWRTMRNDTKTTSATLWNRTRGVTYGLRVRATDRHGNIGTWTNELRVRLP